MAKELSRLQVLFVGLPFHRPYGISLSALFSNRISVAPTERVACLISGGYIDAMDFQGIFEHAMGLMGQHFSCEIVIPDNAT